MEKPIFRPTSTHWGHYQVASAGGVISAVAPNDTDTHPSPIAQSLLDAQDPGCRIPGPHIRQGYLRAPGKSDGRQRGVEPFVAVPWDEALDIAADALKQTIANHGNEAIFGGSYGWSSAGRFHHAQSQLHRFLAQAGGYTASVQNYSFATAQVILPRIIGIDARLVMSQAPTIEDVCKHTRLIVSFGGISVKNTQVNQGGIGNHSAVEQMHQLRQAGVDVVCISPLKDDVADFLAPQWLPIRPNADAALMLGLAHTLYAEQLYDNAFLQRYTVGFERFVPYLTGSSDGIPKDAEWAAQRCDIDAERIRELARRMAGEPCLLSISWSLQRTEHGDQPYWLITLLGAMLGNIGLPGQGVGFGYGCIHNFGFAGRRPLPFKVGEFARGENPVKGYIPVARIADMLLSPGATVSYNGEQLTYPEIKLIYWCGGNPFHHHQDLHRLRDAFSRPECIIVNEPFWTATARQADIVFPATVALEREDFAWGTADLCATPMHQVLQPYADSRNDYDIFSALAARLGFADTFTENRDASAWIRSLWQFTCERAMQQGIELPGFDAFWQGGLLQIDPQQVEPKEFVLEAFRRDPETNPLATPSGKIEIYSEAIAALNLPDCGGHPRWLEKQEMIGSERSRRYPLALNSNQPVTRLHSQYDFGRTSRAAKRHDREPMQIHPEDAAMRDISQDDVVRVYNDRGATLAAATLNANLRPGVIVLPTGAWFDPLDPADPRSLDVHGNPNVLTRDEGSSALSQGTSAHSCLVEVERFDGELPAIRVFEQPVTAPRS